MEPAALDATGAPLPFSTFPYERVTSSRSRFAYFAATPFGYRSKSAWICVDRPFALLELADHAMKEPGARLVRLRADPEADAAVADVLQELGRQARLVRRRSPLWRALALGAPGAGAWAANAALSSSGSHRRPEYSTMRVGSTEMRPRACLAFDGKFGVPGTR